MNNSTPNNSQSIEILNADTLHQACIINHLGEEIPITRAMIEHSCEQLEKHTITTNTKK